MATTPPLWLLISTVALFAAFTVAYGETIFTLPDGGSCDGAISCLVFVYDFLAVGFQFITLGGFNSPLPALLQPILLLFFGVAWGFYIISTIEDAIP